MQHITHGQVGKLGAEDPASGGGGVTLPITEADVTGLVATLNGLQFQIDLLTGGGGGGSTHLCDVTGTFFASPIHDENGGVWTFSAGQANLEIVHGCTLESGQANILDGSGHVVGPANTIYRLNLVLLGGSWLQNGGSSPTPGNTILLPFSDPVFSTPIAVPLFATNAFYQDPGSAAEPCIANLPQPADATRVITVSKFSNTAFTHVADASALGIPICQWYAHN